MVGFAPIGRLSLGQLRADPNIAAVAGSFALAGVSETFQIKQPAASAAYTLTGVSIAETIGESAASGAFALSGVAAPFAVKFAAAAGSYVLTGFAANEPIKEAVTAGAFVLTGFAANEPVQEATFSGSFIVAEAAQFAGAGMDAIGRLSIGQISQPARIQGERFTVYFSTAGGAVAFTPSAAPLSRTGDNYEFKFGGVGHYKLERERAAQLAKITRKPPPPVDLRTAPQFAPIGRAPVVAPVPVVDLASIQNQRMAEQMQAARIQKRRRDEEALLLLAS